MVKRQEAGRRLSKPAAGSTGRRGWRGGISRAYDFALTPENVSQGFNRQFHEQKRLGDEVAAPAQGGTGAALEVGQPGDKHDRRPGVAGQGAQFGAEIESIHAG